MERSRINRIILDADAFLRSLNVHLPPFAYWSPDEWRGKGEDVREIVDNQLGWDITDFGSGEFERTGLFLFTLRNGSVSNLESGRGKTYAEKIMIVDVDQVTPMHFHWNKTEDIINRGGGNLAIQLYAAAADESLDEQSPVTVSMDGVVHTLPAGHTVVLQPGESITLETGMYHEFRGVDERVLVGEVSAVNDDAEDNRFLRPAGRFPDIVEDVAPVLLLVGDYADYYRPGRTA